MATRGSILTGKKLAPAPRAPVVPQMAPVAKYTPADIDRIQREQSRAMLQQPQQPSGLKPLSPQNYQFMPQQPKTAAQAAAFNQPQQPSGLRANSSSLIGTPTQRADENFLKQQEAFMRAMTAQAASAQRMPSAPYNSEAQKVEFNPSKNQQAPMMSPHVAQQAAAMGPKMPGMKKGGVVKKKPGYAKGGGVVAKKTAASKYAKGGVVTTKASNCGASMKPQQRKK